VELVVSSNLSSTIPDSRIHTLIVCNPVEVTLIVAMPPDCVFFDHFQVVPSKFNPVTAGAADVPPSNPTYRESDEPENPNPRIHT